MIEPQTDEERKALRLWQAQFPQIEREGFEYDSQTREYLRILAEARAIFREEQDAKAENTRPSVEEWKAAELQIIAEKEASAARVNAASKAMLDAQVANAEAMANIVQRHTWVPADELADVRNEIRLRSEVLRAFDGAVGAEIGEQRERFVWLLRRERELMGSEWTTEPEGGDRG